MNNENFQSVAVTPYKDFFPGIEDNYFIRFDIANHSL